MEKVISKLSNEELDLVVGGGFTDVMKEIGLGAVNAWIPADSAAWYALVAQYVANVLTVGVSACAGALITYLFTKKDKK
ncbi:MAG: hypothetical protein IJC57_01100 [Clostridia bacterium]|nr:hypothetical protein [Clostridia bacterium]